MASSLRFPCIHSAPQLLAELSLALSDDFRAYIPELLPRFVGLFVDAERTGNFAMVRPALTALEVGGGDGHNAS